VMEENLLASTSARRDEVSVLRTFDGRLIGQTWETPFVEVPNGSITPAAIDAMIANFHAAYEARWGNRFEAIPVEGVTYRVQLVLPTRKVNYPKLVAAESPRVAPTSSTVLRFLQEDELETFDFDRETLCPGNVIEGPAIVREPMSTTHVCAGQVATVGSYGELVITSAAVAR